MNRAWPWAATFFVLCVVFVASTVSCRCGSDNPTTSSSSAGEDASSILAATAKADGPTMPKGLLAAPSDVDGNAPSVVDVVERLSIARVKKGGEWAEIQVAAPNDPPDRTDFTHWKDDSVFLSLDAMTVLHDAFARSLPGFDLFLPRLYNPAALARLQRELTIFRTQLTPMHTASAAKVRWGEVSTTIQGIPDDPTWIRARSALIATIDELLIIAKSKEQKSQSLWVLGI